MSKQYDKKFKEDALKYREDHPELSVAVVCRNLGIRAPTYCNWQNQAKENDGAFSHVGSGSSHTSSENERKVFRNTSRILSNLWCP